MKDNRDPETLGEFLQVCREQENQLYKAIIDAPYKSMSELYDNNVPQRAFRNYGETESQFRQRIRQLQTSALPVGNLT